MARVAASLQDESKPEDSEIASEAKLQKRLGGDAILPRTPRFGPSAGGSSHSVGTAGSSNHGSMRMSKSPFFGATSGPNAGSSRRKYMWDDDVDDIRGVFVADGLDDGESSDISSEEEEMMMYYSRNGSLSDEENEMRSRGFEASSIMQDVVPSSGISADTAGVNDASNSGDGAGNSAALSTSIGSTSAAPSTGVGSLPKRKNNALWMGFRDKGNAHKWSPSASGSTSGAGNGVFTGERAAWRRAGGSSAMDLDTSPRVLGAAGGARLSKRKTMGDDRYEPYKRRAVSPMNLGSSLGTTPANISLAAAAVAASQPGGGSGGGGGSPLLMPISSPSGILHPRIHQHFSAYAARYSTSPTISRPITPVNANPGGPPAMGAFSPAAGAGSGPGYGSGALGLSISANNTQSMESRMMEERQEENEALMDEKVGLMGLS
uniref:Uncharacterized protein n=2 Tax=Kalmanozyma brasiliensis (strain GHG001) TaxID=1365824 RepID=V5ECF3_KALBG